MPKQTTQTTRIVGAIPRRPRDSATASGAFRSVDEKVAAFKQAVKAERPSRDATSGR